MTTSIFIKTWKNDLEWLDYSLQSIRKFASGFSEIVIVADDDCTDLMGFVNLNGFAGFADLIEFTDGARILFYPKWKNGYIQQQFVKLMADKYVDTDQILFVDSDCIFTCPFSPESFMRDGRPVLLKTRYGNLGGAEAWKVITENAVGWTVEYEYMRRLPWMYKRSTLIAFREMFPELPDRLRSITSNSFSEFNCLGAFIDRHENDRYFVSDTEVWMPPLVAKQFWSWGTLTPEIRNEIEGIVG